MIFTIVLWTISLVVAYKIGCRSGFSHGVETTDKQWVAELKLIKGFKHILNRNTK